MNNLKQTGLPLLLFIISLTLVCVITVPVLAEEEAAPVRELPGNELQALLDNIISDDAIPGAVMGVKTPGGVWMGAAGKAGRETGQQMTVDTTVRLASITKQFTAVLVMKLIEDNLLSLNDTVEKWLPGAVKDGNKITIEMLLNHTSGIVDHEGNESFWQHIAAEPRATWSSEDVLALIKDKDLQFSPGTKWSYSNTGYYLLGLIVEKATGDTVNSEMNRLLFNPLGMDHTTVTRTGKKPEPYAHDYSWFAMDPYNQLIDTSDWDLSWDWTAGSAVSTVGDMLTWAEALFGGEVLQQATLKAMTNNAFKITETISYGYGLIISTNDYGEKVYSHDGENPGVETDWLYYPESQTTIFIAFNRSDFPYPEPVNANKIMLSVIGGIHSILDTHKN